MSVADVLREKGMCGSVSPDGKHACIKDAEHAGAHGWQDSGVSGRFAEATARAEAMQRAWGPEYGGVIELGTIATLALADDVLFLAARLAQANTVIEAAREATAHIPLYDGDVECKPHEDACAGCAVARALADFDREETP